MSSPPLLDDLTPEQHVVQLYSGDDSLLFANVARYVAEGLRRNNCVLLLMPLVGTWCLWMLWRWRPVRKTRSGASAT